MNALRILLADDHPQVLANFRRLADKVGEVVGAVADGRVAVEESLRLRPDVIILDVSMPSLNGLEAARMLHRELPDSKLIISTVNKSRKTIEEAFAAGARGFVWKQRAHEDLPQAIRAVTAGEVFLSTGLGEVEHRGENNREGMS